MYQKGSAILTSVFLFFLLYQKLPCAVQVGICVLVGGFLWLSGGHVHGGISAIDLLAQRSKLQTVHRQIKFFAVMALLILCLISRNVWTGIAVCLLCACCTVGIGRVSLHEYLALLCVPVSFLLLSCFAVLFEVHHELAGVCNIALWDGAYLCVTKETQEKALLLVVRAMGGLSSLYALSLSTTMSQIIAQCKALYVPDLLIELMYLMYRYIFILSDVHRRMYHAAESRLGLSTYRRQVTTLGTLYANLFAQSFRQASKSFDAMESRGYQGKMNFFVRKVPLKRAHVFFACALIAIVMLVEMGGML